MDSELEKRVVKLIQDNATWGSNRIVGALTNLGYTLSDVTIENIRRRNGFGGWSQTKEVLYSSCCQPVKPNGDIVFCTTDTYADQYTAYGNICNKSFLEIPREIVCRDYGHRHISAASWVRVRDPQSGERIWQGKDYRFRSPKNRLRTSLETQNYAWLSTAKRIANSIQNRLKPDSEENQTNLD